MLNVIDRSKLFVVSAALVSSAAGLLSAPAFADGKERTVSVSRTTTVNNVQRRNKLSMNLAGHVETYSASRYLPRQAIATDEDIKKINPYSYDATTDMPFTVGY